MWRLLSSDFVYLYSISEKQPTTEVNPSKRSTPCYTGTQREFGSSQTSIHDTFQREGGLEEKVGRLDEKVRDLEEKVGGLEAKAGGLADEHQLKLIIASDRNVDIQVEDDACDALREHLLQARTHISSTTFERCPYFCGKPLFEWDGIIETEEGDTRVLWLIEAKCLVRHTTTVPTKLGAKKCGTMGHLCSS